MIKFSVFILIIFWILACHKNPTITSTKNKREMKKELREDMEDLEAQIEKMRAEYLKNPPPAPRNFEEIIPNKISSQKSDSGFICRISCKTPSIKKKNVVIVETEIFNQTLDSFKLIPFLTGSEYALRYPVIKFLIQKIKDKEIPTVIEAYSLNGFTDGILKKSHIKGFKKGEKFDPFFWTNINASYGERNFRNAKENWLYFDKPGKYRIQLFYSTKSEKVEDFCLDNNFKNLKEIEITEIKSILNSIPQITLISNEIEIEVK